MIKKVFFVSLVVLAMASCEKINTNSNSYAPLCITEAILQTKAVVTGSSFPTNEAVSVGLTVTASNGGNYDGKTSGYTNVQCTKAAGSTSWKPASEVMLSASEGKLYAYYPYSNSTNISSIPVSSSVNGTDYMWATPMTVSKSSASASLQMNHALARITVVLKKGTSYTNTGSLSKLSFEGNGIAASGTLDAKTGNVTASKSTASFNVSATLTTTGVTQDCLIVPANPSSTAQSVTLKCTIDGQEYSVNLSDAKAIIVNKGVQSTVTLTLNNGSLSVDTVGITQWGSGSNVGESL